MANIEWNEAAINDLEKLDKPVAQRILKKIDWLSDNFEKVAPELSISSFGDTPEDAKASVCEAIEAFVEECQEMGALEEILKESGFSKLTNSWVSRKPLLEENLAIAI